MNGSWFVKLESPSHNNALCQVFKQGGPLVVEKKIFLILSMYLHYFVIISPWKRAGPFIWTNLNLLHPRMLCPKFEWNWHSGSGEAFGSGELKGSLKQTHRYISMGHEIYPKVNIAILSYIAPKSLSRWTWNLILS